MNVITVNGSWKLGVKSRSTMDGCDIRAVDRACEIEETEKLVDNQCRIERRAIAVLNAAIIVVALSAAIAFALFFYISVRRGRETFMDRMRENGGQSAVDAVIRANKEPLVRECNYVSNAIFWSKN